MKKLLIAAAAAATLVGFGCNTRSNAPANGTGGSGYSAHNPGDDSKRIGDGKIGRNNGVIDDGEGPLEQNGKSDDKIGNQPGVWNDGEGPIESTPLNRPSDSGKSFNNDGSQVNQ